MGQCRPRYRPTWWMVDVLGRPMAAHDEAALKKAFDHIGIITQQPQAGESWAAGLRCGRPIRGCIRRESSNSGPKRC